MYYVHSGSISVLKLSVLGVDNTNIAIDNSVTSTTKGSCPHVHGYIQSRLS